MDVQQQRAAIANAYPGPSWAKKVQTMSDAQVTAVYLRFVANGKI